MLGMMMRSSHRGPLAILFSVLLAAGATLLLLSLG